MKMITVLAFRRSICRLLMGVLVSTQLAIAAYACAGPSRMPMAEQGQPAGAVMVMAEDGMLGGSGPLDAALPNLCLAHCQHGQQSGDHSPAPTVPAMLLTSLYTLPALAEGSVTTAPDGAPPAAAPPHAVLHCCLRI